MARTDARFRAAYEQTLTLLQGERPGTALASETTLAAELKVSRTVVRSVLTGLQAAGIIAWDGRAKTLLRAPLASDHLPARDDYISLEALESRFLDWVLRFDVPAGTPLNVAQLAKQFSVPPHSLQEFLSGLSHFGLVERRPRGGWRLLGFTPDYAVELTEFRMVLEMNAVRALATLPQSHPVWAQLTALRADHVALLQRIETDFHDFSKLDEQFHGTINSVVRNRFVEEFQKVISLIFHYHYQWDKKRERQRNETAIREHLTILDALQRHDGAAAEAAARAHLLTSKETLLASLRVNMLA